MKKYDIVLKHEKGGITQAEVPWATDVETRQVVDIIAGLLWNKERNPEAFAGNIIISEVQEAKVIPLPACEIDHSDSQAQYTRRDG